MSATKRMLKKRGRARLAAALSFGVLLVAGIPGTASASPFSLFSPGPRGAAMGGAAVALSDDFMAAYYNPAGLVNSDRLVMGAGYSYLFSDLHLDGRTLEMFDTNYGATSAGFSVAGPIHGYRVGAGLAFALTDQATILSRLLGPEQERFALLDNQTQVVDIDAAAAMQLFPWLAFGAGVSFGADLRGNVHLNANFFPQEASGALDVEIQYKVFPMAGVLITPIEGLRMGLAYRDALKIPLELPTVADLTVVENSSAGAVLTFFLSQTYFYTPQQVEVGVSYDLGDRVTLSADLAWVDWSTFGDPNVIGHLNATGSLASLLHAPQVVPPEHPEFHDIFVPRLGVEAKVARGELWDLFLRLGYSYQPSPSPMKEGSVNLMDNDKHVGSAGIGFDFRDPWGLLLGPASIDLSGQYFRFAERHVRKTDPTDTAGDLVFGGDRFVINSMVTIRLE